MDEMVITYKFVSETKKYFKYEPDSDSSEIVGQIYIGKSKITGEVPKELTVTIAE